MTTVMIVDDHVSVRLGLRRLVEELGWRVVLECDSIAQASHTWHSEPWTLGILDLNLGDGDGLELLARLRAKGCSAPILVHSLLPDSAMAKRVFKAGGHGFMGKDAPLEDLVAALHRVASGRRYVSPEFAEEMAESMVNGTPVTPHERLSPREFKVMCLMAAGKSPPEVAESIGCHVNTISTYRARILKKLELKSSMDIVRYALSRRLVPL